MAPAFTFSIPHFYSALPKVIPNSPYTQFFEEFGASMLFFCIFSYAFSFTFHIYILTHFLHKDQQKQTFSVIKLFTPSWQIL